jgi:transcriptional regulator with XRE-family HTH domain
MIEAAQIRAARALIGCSQAKLAEKAGVPESTIKELETGAPGRGANEADTDKIRIALETAGVVFLPKEEGGGGLGVRLHEAREGEYIGWNDLNASNDE